MSVVRGSGRVLESPLEASLRRPEGPNIGLEGGALSLLSFSEEDVSISCSGIWYSEAGSDVGKTDSSSGSSIVSS